MFKLVAFFQKRPSDRTILLGRMTFGFLIALILGLNLENIILILPEGLKAYETSIIYGLFIFAIVPFFMGATGICLAKRKYVRIIQICFGIVLLIAGNSLIDTKTPILVQDTITVQSGSLDYGAISESKTPSKSVNVGFWIALLGILPLLAGITGKCITSKCLKYGEVIKKIRV
ncbi:hypothetical protein GW819_01985 [Candidatus Gracilibacteria bacterium]|nr:hypothetical protein [bacterium]NDK19587.1 hypothetical protein [Candidatus Gracilibacteria bacterium]OIO77664.1 MAG: hypothetical protein AUJ87_00860 [Candidatus Gracilibacteria bacterium CG1_02_38_174]PIQ11454.1 MAG: hypothetical protein COW68_02560 [Candidatus Gracilibacteria bacterium CG18_big_fil_WC_8_21_14_2_50_38_16]PIQ41853.1 MAG: hypothetical protein COW06_01580 [Candidatus Gracilibacteria bacterium CG12_big_fil_rev_8_21_14_0_65_38_15]PIZ02058.1 MAG: hypothetical protein COY60_0027